MLVSYSAEIEVQMQRYYQSLSEKDRRRYAGIEAVKLGHGGIAYISRVLGCDYRTIKAGMAELEDDGAHLEEPSIRRGGGGRKSAFDVIDGLDAAFLKVMEHHTAGSPVDETVKWTNLSRPKIAELLQAEQIDVSVTVVDQLLKKHHYRRRRARKTLATGASHPQRNEQFENIDTLRKQYTDEGNPVMSMDTKKEN
ncbi:rhodopirellula transposase family protein [Leptolyngbya sp. Heron Island J]|uniref:ISAzo13-like element transposase-related protein n=1 Tax=Leptolyngbya sp. Heron Island J TaxID=1385935 RepID=UPI0003B9D003|nr:transposase [Leptolyngbya sp. Heron Island J]ESA34023.1 rhodopirellula transposase family protein [Leptolyngbya sp. Heron Island J]